MKTQRHVFINITVIALGQPDNNINRTRTYKKFNTNKTVYQNVTYLFQAEHIKLHFEYVVTVDPDVPNAFFCVDPFIENEVQQEPIKLNSINYDKLHSLL